MHGLRSRRGESIAISDDHIALWRAWHPASSFATARRAGPGSHRIYRSRPSTNGTNVRRPGEISFYCLLGGGVCEVPAVSIVRKALGPIFRGLPMTWRREIRTRRLESIVRRGRFTSDEYEFGRLQEWLSPSDTALDVGANFGTYSLRMSQLVGDKGRVSSFEPVPQTFAIMTRLLSTAGCKNVTALNLACSDGNRFASIAIPDEAVTGEDLYRATIMEGGASAVTVCCIKLDDLALPFGAVAGCQDRCGTARDGSSARDVGHCGQKEACHDHRESPGRTYGTFGCTRLQEIPQGAVPKLIISPGRRLTAVSSSGGVQHW